MTQLKQLKVVANYGNSLTEFSFTSANQKVTSYLIDGQAYFNAAQVCKVLDLTDVSKSLQRLDEDEKLMRTVFVSGQNRQVWLVNESGLYNLIFSSRKAEARAFRKKVTNEILPEIRRTGSYQPLPAQPQLFKGIKSKHINGRKMVPYRQFLLSVGYGPKSSGYHYTVNYSGHFVTMGPVKYVTEDLALHIYHSRRIAANRSALKEAQPVLPLNFGDVSLLNKGGSHVHH